MARNKGGKLAQPDAWSTAVELPRAGLPDERARAKSHRRMKRYAAFSMFAVPLLLVVSLVAVMSTVSDKEAEAPVVEAAPATQPLAMAAVEDWLAARPAPLPGASLLVWEDYEVLPSIVDPDAPNPDRTERQSHTLLVRASTGALMRVQVLVAVSPQGGQAVIGTPSLTVTVGQDDSLASASLWSGLRTEAPSSDVTQAVNTWVTAYTSGDPVALRQTVGDPDASHVYLPLSGLSGARGTVRSGAWVTEGTGDKAVRTGDMVLSLTITLPWGQQAAADAKQGVATFDLLVTGADTAAPRVVAWGGPGTGPTLTPYANAVIGKLADQPQPVPTNITPEAAPAAGDHDQAPPSVEGEQ